ncbi:MAG: 5-oxoprolinase subunit PxpB [Ruminococcaceae bacterium]|jgi:inhibitor of KinA|nr:5-oxoprolinase subunit PxpB [Oscillospiraceae bacterium]
MSRDIRPCGDSAVTVEFRQVIDPSVNAEIFAFCQALERLQPPGVVEIVPAYCAVTVHFDPMVITMGELRAALDAIPEGTGENGAQDAPLIEIPVCYGGAHGPDMASVMAHTGLSEQEIVARHSGGDYLIYMLGFTPGFPYMGGMDESLSTPRLKTPRTAIPAGSVGIAGSQTGVYPIASPGGWQLIGRTPLKLFDLGREQPFLLQAGARVKFVPISAEEYERLDQND